MKAKTLRDACAKAAGTIGDELCAEAYWHGERCNWVGRSPDEAVMVGAPLVPTVAALGPDLYGGTAGIALFLAELHAKTGEVLHRKTALGAIQQALDAVHQVQAAVRIGFYSGAIGIAYTAARLAVLLDEPPLLARGLSTIADAGTSLSDDHPLDQIGGNAGAICALLAIARLPGAGSVLDDAVRLGEELLACATADDGVYTWAPERATGASVGDRPLTGLAHGASGIAVALLELHARTGDSRFLDAGTGAFAYEDRWFSASQENWADLRNLDELGRLRESAEDAPPSYMTAWCYGAPGIGLARLRAWELLPDRAERLAQSARAAASGTRRHVIELRPDSAGDATPCHGISGSLELLGAASLALGGPEVSKAMEQGWTMALAWRRQTGRWISGLASGGKNPSLMLGDAGVGHCLLRFVAPERVPPVLLVRGDAPCG